MGQAQAQQTGVVRVEFEANPPIRSELFDFIPDETIVQFRNRVQERVNRQNGRICLVTIKRNRKTKVVVLDETEMIQQNCLYRLIDFNPTPALPVGIGAPANDRIRINFPRTNIPTEEFDFIAGEKGLEFLDRVRLRTNRSGGSLVVYTTNKAMIDIGDDEIIEKGRTYSLSGSVSAVALAAIVAPAPSEVIWTKPPLSASAVINKCPWFHDPFSHILPSDGYIPNRRLMELQITKNYDTIIVDRIHQAILGSCLVLDSFRFDRSETNVEDPNLTFLFNLMGQNLRDVLRAKGQLPANTNLEFTSRKALQKEDVYLANSCKPQPRISFQTTKYGDVTFMASDAKGIQASLDNCRSELLTVCGSGAIKLHRIGLNLEDAVTVGVAHAGNCFQFFGFYLVEPSFPVTVALSRVYNISSSIDDVNEVAVWFAKCLNLVVDFAQLVGNEELHLQNISDVRINGDGHFFFKPIRSPQELQNSEKPPTGQSPFQLRINQFMRVYSTIDALNKRRGNVSDFVDLPLGVITVPNPKAPDDIDVSLQQFAENLAALVRRHFERCNTVRMLIHRPLMIFPQLNATEWQSTRPRAENETEYREALGNAIEFLNTAGVAHLDLPPANIMWTVANGKMRIKVIDFEDAVIFGQIILQSFIASKYDTNDYRFPFNQVDQLPPIAEERHNTYFSFCITAWLNEPNSPDFDIFMIGQWSSGGCEAAERFFKK